MRRKALVIMGFETPDFKLSPVHKGWNDYHKERPERHIRPTVSSDFLIAKDKKTKKVGFPEIVLKDNESVMEGLYRYNPSSRTAIIKPWRQVTAFRNKDWHILVGLVGVHPDQRQVDLYEQSDELPFLVAWETPGWLFRQAAEKNLNYLTRLALARPEVSDFLRTTQQAAPV